MVKLENLIAKYIGNNHLREITVTSTNELAADMLSKSKPSEGTAISSCFQTLGKGQIGRYWESEPDKNILCSIILYPDFILASNQFSLNIAISLAVRAFVATLLPDNEAKICIKWPNDIYIGDKKIAGILIQNSVLGSAIKNTIVGIGINVNQVVFSPEIPNPTSINLECGAEHDLKKLFPILFYFLEHYYELLMTSAVEKLESEYHNHLYRYKTWHTYRIGDTTFLGKIIGVRASGTLQIVDKDNNIGFYAFREIEFVI